MSPEQFCPSCACDTVCLLVLAYLQRVPRLPRAGHGPGLGEHALLHAGVPVHGHVQRHDPEGVLGLPNVRDGQGGPSEKTHFSDGEIEVWRGKETCPRDRPLFFLPNTVVSLCLWSGSLGGKICIYNMLYIYT